MTSTSASVQALGAEWLVSVIVPTHNPRPDYLGQTIAGLRSQTLPLAQWELLLIDNASAFPLSEEIIAWHPNGRVVREGELGLTAARCRGVSESRASLLVWADDDNVLDCEYLTRVVDFFARFPQLGAAGGIARPVFESTPPAWHAETLAPIGCRDLGEKEIWAAWHPGERRQYPHAAPIGAGLAIRRSAMELWTKAVRQDSRRRAFGRTGEALTSGEDNDINLTLLGAGWQLAYFPGLVLKHLIPERRLRLDYQCRIARACFRDFTRVLLLHGVSPWPEIPAWTLPLRKMKAWFACRAWSSPAARITWEGICGQFEGRVRRSASMSLRAS